MNLSSSKVLISGGSGMLASALQTLIPAKEIICLGRNELDVSSVDSINSVIEKHRPDIVIHTAAFTNVEACETETEKATAVNALGTKNLSLKLKEENPEALFVYLSSTGIYGTEKLDSPYSEEDIPAPTTVHHRTKFEGEGYLKDHFKNHLVIRTGWLFGGSVEHAKNFVYKRFLEAQGKSEIYGDPTQSGNPTYVKDLANQIIKLIESNETGVFNCVGEGSSSRLNYVQKILEAFNLPCKVAPAPEGLFKRVAPVSKNETAENKKLKDKNLNIMRPWEEALSEYVLLLKEQIDG